jgi:hypothetical protein
MIRQAGDNPLLDIFTGAAAIAKSQSVDGRRNEWGIGSDQIKALASYWFQKIADSDFKIRYAGNPGIETRAEGRALIDVHGDNAL